MKVCPSALDLKAETQNWCGNVLLELTALDGLEAQKFTNHQGLDAPYSSQLLHNDSRCPGAIVQQGVATE